MLRIEEKNHVAVNISLLYLRFSLSLLQFQHILVSFVAISAALCRCFKATALRLNDYEYPEIHNLFSSGYLVLHVYLPASCVAPICNPL